MLIAKEKRKNNLAEYILYIWQLEDLMRALNFDLNEIGKNIVSRFNTDDETRLEIYDWYKNLVKMMQDENVTGSGHVKVIIRMVNELNQFHFRLLKESNDSRYLIVYQDVHPVLEELRQKSGNQQANEIQIALEALYSKILLDLKKSKISDATNQAFQVIGRFLGHLSARYRQFEEGEFDI